MFWEEQTDVVLSPSCVSSLYGSSKLPNLSKPQFPSLYNGEIIVQSIFSLLVLVAPSPTVLPYPLAAGVGI